MCESAGPWKSLGHMFQKFSNDSDLFFFFSTLLKLKFGFVQRSERIAMKTWNFTGPWLQKFTLLLSPWTLGLRHPSKAWFFWNAIYRMSQQRTSIFKLHGRKNENKYSFEKGQGWKVSILLFPVLCIVEFWKISGSKKKCVSMNRCIHLLINGFSKKILTPSQRSGGAANNKTIIRRAESTKAIRTGTEVCLESSSLEKLYWDWEWFFFSIPQQP